MNYFNFFLFFFISMIFLQPTPAHTKVSLSDVVYVATKNPFYINIFEASKNQAMKEGVQSSYDPSNKDKPDRMSINEAESYCLGIGMKLASKEQWIQAASNLGNNKKFSTINDNVEKNGKYYNVNISSGDSDSIWKYWKHGIDAIGTVGLTGNRPEWVRDRNGDVVQCGGGYETKNTSSVELSKICQKDSSFWVSSTATARCVYEVSSPEEVEITLGPGDYTLLVNPSSGRTELKDYLYSIKYGLSREKHVDEIEFLKEELEIRGVKRLLIHDSDWSKMDNDDPKRLDLLIP